MVQQNPDIKRVSEYTILLDKFQALQEKYAALHKKDIKLEQENEVLRHCWDKARIDIDRLQRECQLLQRHLNPKELIERDRPTTKRNTNNATV